MAGMGNIEADSLLRGRASQEEGLVQSKLRQSPACMRLSPSRGRRETCWKNFGLASGSLSKLGEQRKMWEQTHPAPPRASKSAPGDISDFYVKCEFVIANEIDDYEY